MGGHQKGKRNRTWADQRNWYPEAIHYTQEKEEGSQEGGVAPVRGLLIHILLSSVHILRGLHPKQPSEGVGGTHTA